MLHEPWLIHIQGELGGPRSGWDSSLLLTLGSGSQAGALCKFPRLFAGHEPTDPRAGSGTFETLAGRVGSGEEVSPGVPGKHRRFPRNTGRVRPDRVTLTRPDPNREK